MCKTTHFHNRGNKMVQNIEQKHIKIIPNTKIFWVGWKCVNVEIFIKHLTLSRLGWKFFLLKKELQSDYSLHLWSLLISFSFRKHSFVSLSLSGMSCWVRERRLRGGLWIWRGESRSYSRSSSRSRRISRRWTLDFQLINTDDTQKPRRLLLGA